MRSRHARSVRVVVGDVQAASQLLPYVQQHGSTEQCRLLERIIRREGTRRPRRLWLAVTDRPTRRWLCDLSGPRRRPTLPREARQKQVKAAAINFAQPVEELDLTVRTYNCLKREGINNVGDLVARSEKDLTDIAGFGQKSLDEVKMKLAGLDGKPTLGMTIPASAAA
jgi:hypothetical protein